MRAALTRAIVTFTALTHGELVPVMVSRCLLTRSAPIAAVAEQPALVAGAPRRPGAAVAATNGAASGARPAAGGVVGATSASLSVKTVGPPAASWKRTSESWIEPVAGMPGAAELELELADVGEVDALGGEVAERDADLVEHLVDAGRGRAGRLVQRRAVARGGGGDRPTLPALSVSSIVKFWVVRPGFQIASVPRDGLRGSKKLTAAPSASDL